MADKELVIKISEKAYNALTHNEFDANLIVDEMRKAIATGTPLPKGHRFIDADEILNHAFITEDEEGDIFVQKYYCIKKEFVDNALVLFNTLESDKEQEDGNDDN